MARIIVRNTAISGSIPTTLVQGELALNVTDGKLYYGSSSRNIVKEFTGSGGGGGGSSISASYAATASYAFTSSYSQNLQISGSINNVDYIDFNTSASVTQPIPGRLSWNDTDGTLDIGLKGGNVTLQVGQEEIIRIVNKTGGNLLEADYHVVRVRSVAEGGAQGQRLAVVLAQADNDANSATTLGIVTETINVNQEGFITVSGLVRGINTTGTLQGETWVDGDMLYLSPTTPGHLTNIKPVAPQHMVIMGYVVYAHNNQGKIFVKVDNGYEIDELHNVLINTGSLTPGQLLVRSGSVWVNSNQLTGSYGLTGSLTISGSLNISGSTNAFIQNGNSFGATAVLGTNDNQSLALETSGSTRMFISSNGRVGIGTSTPLFTLDIQSAATGSLRISGSGGSQITLVRPTAGLTGFLRYVGTTMELGTAGSDPLNLFTGNTARLAIDTSGNIGIGTGAASLSARLGVRGSGTTSATTAFLVQNSTPSTLFSILDNGNTGIRTLTPSATLDVSGSVNISGSGVQVPFQVYSGVTPILQVSSSGKISIASTTNAGYALEVYDNGIYYAGAGQQAQLLIATSGSVNREGAFIAASTGRTLQMGINDNSTVPVGIDMFETNNSYPSTYLNFRVNNADLVRMTGSFVGIGTTNPTATLDVSGSARITNGLVITGSLIVSGSGTQGSINTVTRLLTYAGITSIDWRTRTLNNSAGTAVLDWDQYQINDSLASSSIDWDQRILSDANTLSSVEYNDRRLRNSTNDVILDWENGVLTGTASTSSFVNTLNQNVIITGSLTVGTSSLGPYENTITLGARDAGSEGGQIGFNASGGTYTSASFIDLYQNRLRILKGTNDTSTGEVARWDMHNLQMGLPAYTNSGSFPGTGVTMLTTDTNGNVLTQAFRDVAEQTYTGTIAWTGTAAPSGSTTHTYRWSQVGKTVNLNITLVYTGPGNAVSTVTTALPADCPTPYVPSGQSGAGALISIVSAHLTTTTTIGANIARGGLRINSTNNGYELSATATAAGYKVLVTSVQYFAV